MYKKTPLQFAQLLYERMSNYVGEDHKKHCVNFLTFFISSMKARIDELEIYECLTGTTATLNVEVMQKNKKLQENLRDIRNAAMPDPFDERDLSLEWLVKLIMEKTSSNGP